MTWRVEGSIARLSCGSLEGRIDLAATTIGLDGILWNGSPTDWHLLGTAPLNVHEAVPRKLVDCYVRAGDLVAIYQRQPPATAAPQIYWRQSWDAPLQAIGIELILSMQTDLLDSSPHSIVSSRCSEVTPFTAQSLSVAAFRDLSDATSVQALPRGDRRIHLYVFRHVRLGFSYAECIHPDDYVLAEFHPQTPGRPDCSTRWWLFNERLEKGVIRRARICGWFLPAENDLAVAVELAKQFIDEPLPLTT